MPEHYLERLQALLVALPSAKAPDVLLGSSTLAMLILWPRLSRHVPAPLVALALAGGAAWCLSVWAPDLAVATIGSRFSHLVAGLPVPGIPREPPRPAWPWTLPGPDGQPLGLSFSLVRSLLPSGFAIAMLGAIESLLSAVVSDGMTGRKHDPDVELLAQGLANVAAPCFGGIAATGAIARTATSVRSGARSPLAAAGHAAFVLAAVLALAPLLGFLPMASLAALLLVVAWNMSEWRHFVHLLRAAPRSDVAVLLACFGLTIVFDMVVAVTVGIVLAALLFMRRMAEVTGAAMVGEGHPELAEPLPRGGVLYEIAGPLFFGAAQKAMTALRAVEQREVRVVVLDLARVPAIDATGIVALQSLVDRLNEAGTKVILVRLQRQPLRALARAGWRNRKGRLRIFQSFERGVALARRTLLDRR